MTGNNGHEKSIWQMVNEKFDCDHEIQSIRKRGASQFVMQCEACGQATTSAIAHSKLTDKQRQSAEPFDESIRDAWDAGRRDYHESLVLIADAKKDAERQAEKKEWFQHYAEFLRSYEWKAQRVRVLRRDGYICQACGVQEAREVHHTSYKYHPHTPDYLLQSLCVGCHERITAIDRGEAVPA